MAAKKARLNSLLPGESIREHQVRKHSEITILKLVGGICMPLLQLKQ